ncbi:MAG: hypothetical protein AAB778_01700 [Patescibacteria group bacterium]
MISITPISDELNSNDISLTLYKSAKPASFELIKQGVRIQKDIEFFEEISINGANAFMYIENPKRQGWPRHKNYYLYKNNYAISIQNTGDDDVLLDQIVSTVVIN